jgi:hypothetical protein
MKPIAFRQNPAYVPVTDAIGLVFEHLRANVVVWVLPVIAYAVISGGLSGALVTRFVGYLGPAPMDREASRRLAAAVLENLPALAGFVVLLLLAGVALSWVALALAVGGLPARTMTVDGAVGAGVRTVLAGLLYGLVFALTWVLLALVLVALAGRAVWLLVVLVPIAVAAWCYVLLRLQLVSFAIFDGGGVLDSLRTSWALTRGAVLRTLGWVLLLGLISFGVSVASSIVGAPFGAVPIIAGILSGVLTAAMQVFQTTTLGILYESQRMRHVMSTPGASWLPGSGPGLPAPGQVPAPTNGVASDPLQPPPPPPPRPW